MKTLSITIVAVLLSVACNKTIDKLPQKLDSKDLNKAVTTYYLDTTYAFQTNGDYSQMPFDSCTNEYVDLHGKIHTGYYVEVQDSIIMKDSNWIHYDSVFGIGMSTGRHYKYHNDVTSKHTDVWRDSCYFQTRNFMYSRLRLATSGEDNDFVVSVYIKVIADREGNILTDSMNYNYGVCK